MSQFYKVGFATQLFMFLLLWVAWCSSANAEKNSSLAMNEVNVLLSWNSRGTILEASGADCFTWSTTDPELIQILPADQKNIALATRNVLSPNTCTNRVRVCSF